MDLEDTSNTEGIGDREERQHDEEAEMLVEGTEQEENYLGISNRFELRTHLGRLFRSMHLGRVY